MTATTHGEENVEFRKAEALVARRNSIECSRVIKDMIVKGEFATENKRISEIAPSMQNLLPGHQIDALGLDADPVGLPDFSSSSLKVVCADFTGPVSFDCLFDLTVLSCGGIFRSMTVKTDLKALTDTRES